MSGGLLLQYVEIDIPYCSLSYGVSPCTAAIGVTGAAKCFNSIKTCQDRDNFDEETVTLRFAVDTDYLPGDIAAIPSITGISVTPATISLGENLGERATLEVKFRDGKWNDTGEGFDKYYAEREYDALEQGTFWGKFRARQPFLRGRKIRLIRGFLGEAIADMETRHFFIDSFDGPGRDHVFRIVAKDLLKFADGDRAQAPALSSGYLQAGISASATAATLAPAGIGDEEYPASGLLNIGGKEIVSFTRSGDSLTISAATVAHDAEEKAQLCLQYSAQRPSAIIADLFTNYAGIDADYIPTAAWLTEDETYFQRLLSTVIAEPTPVSKLVSELIEQAGLAVWWDERGEQVRLLVLRGISTDVGRFTPSNVLPESLATKDQPSKRLSQVWIFYGLVDPLKRIDDQFSYRSAVLTIEADAEADYGISAIKKIYSRWIPFGGRLVAQRTADILLSRFRDPPRAVSFDLLRTGDFDALPGAGYRMASWPFLQNADGSLAEMPIQVTRVTPDPAQLRVEGEEMLFAPISNLLQNTVIFDSNVQNVSARGIFDQLYPTPTPEDEVPPTFIISEGVRVGSAHHNSPAFNLGDWPDGVVPVVEIRAGARIQGAGAPGGNGAFSSVPAQAGGDGGTAIYSRHPFILTNDGGLLYGGGGGGGGGGRSASAQGGGGGGGAGNVGGPGGQGWGPPQAQAGNGTEDSGGGGNAPSFGGQGGQGGNPGQAGAVGETAINAGGAGGAAGAAIDGNSYLDGSSDLGTYAGTLVN